MTDTLSSAGTQSSSTLRLGVVGAARILNAHLRGIKLIRAAPTTPRRSVDEDCVPAPDNVSVIEGPSIAL